MAPLEPQKKVLVATEFLDSDHGEIACETCHGGNADAQDKSLAHEGLVPIPSLTDPEGTCGECHEEIAASAKNSLHVTLGPFATILAHRADQDKYKTSTWALSAIAANAIPAAAAVMSAGLHRWARDLSTATNSRPVRT